jgi:hypothetical protein
LAQDRQLSLHDPAREDRVVLIEMSTSLVPVTSEPGAGWRMSIEDIAWLPITDGVASRRRASSSRSAADVPIRGSRENGVGGLAWLLQQAGDCHHCDEPQVPAQEPMRAKPISTLRISLTYLARR